MRMNDKEKKIQNNIVFYISIIEIILFLVVFFTKKIDDYFEMLIIFILIFVSLDNIFSFFLKLPMYHRFVSAEADRNPILRIIILLISLGLLIAIGRSLYLMP